jgi:hypothetical protein
MVYFRSPFQKGERPRRFADRPTRTRRALRLPTWPPIQKKARYGQTTGKAVCPLVGFGLRHPCAFRRGNIIDSISAYVNIRRLLQPITDGFVNRLAAHNRSHVTDKPLIQRLFAFCIGLSNPCVFQRGKSGLYIWAVREPPYIINAGAGFHILANAII